MPNLIQQFQEIGLVSGIRIIIEPDDKSIIILYVFSLFKFVTHILGESNDYKCKKYMDYLNGVLLCLYLTSNTLCLNP